MLTVRLVPNQINSRAKHTIQFHPRLTARLGSTISPLVVRASISQISRANTPHLSRQHVLPPPPCELHSLPSPSTAIPKAQTKMAPLEKAAEQVRPAKGRNEDCRAQGEQRRDREARSKGCEHRSCDSNLRRKWRSRRRQRRSSLSSLKSRERLLPVGRRKVVRKVVMHEWLEDERRWGQKGLKFLQIFWI